MKKTANRILGILLAVVMLIGLLPTIALAGEAMPEDAVSQDGVLTVPSEYPSTYYYYVLEIDGHELTCYEEAIDLYKFCVYEGFDAGNYSYNIEVLNLSDNSHVVNLGGSYYFYYGQHQMTGYSCIWAETFEDFSYSAFSTTFFSLDDLDGDGYCWNVFSEKGCHGSKSLVSYSYDSDTDTALSPNNVLYFPDLILSDKSLRYLLTLQVASLDSNAADETIEVYAYQANTSEVLVDTVVLSDSDFTTVTVDLSHLAGKDVWVDLIHNTTDGSSGVLLDDVYLWEENAISSVAITDVPAPDYGSQNTWALPTLPEDADYTFALKNGIGTERIRWVEHDAPATLNQLILNEVDCTWHHLEDNDTFTFAEDKYYTYVVNLAATNGHFFSDRFSTPAKMNGEKAKTKLSAGPPATLIVATTYLPKDAPKIPLDKVEITGVAEPLIGRTPSFSFNCPNDAVYEPRPDSDNDCCVWIRTTEDPRESGDLYDYLSHDGEWMYESVYGGVSFDFEEGYYYTFLPYIQLEPAYTLAESTVFMINDRMALANNGDFFYIFGPVEYVQIDAVEITGVTEPALGQSPVFSFECPNEAPYYARYDSNDDCCAWIRTTENPNGEHDILLDGDWMYASGIGDVSFTFEEGYYYTFYPFVQAETGYAFDSSTPGTINGNKAHIKYDYFYTFEPLQREPIESVTLSGLRPVKPGEDWTTNTATIDTDKAVIDDQAWLDLDTALPITGAFEEDARYIYSLSLATETEYAFTEETRFLYNGMELTALESPTEAMSGKSGYCLQGDGAYATIYIYMDDIPAPQPIESVTLSDLRPVKPGEDWTTNTATIDTDKAVIDDQAWLDLDTALPITGAFEEGARYIYSLSLAPAAEYTFTDETRFLYNGMELTALESPTEAMSGKSGYCLQGDGAYATIYIYMDDIPAPATTVVDSVALTDVNAPIIGAKPEFTVTIPNSAAYAPFTDANGTTSAWIRTENDPTKDPDAWKTGERITDNGGSADIVFEAGYYYTFVTSLQAVDASFASDVTATVNGMDASLAELVDGNLFVYCCFGLLEGEGEVLLGDANDDGLINMKDVLLVRKFMAGFSVTMNEKGADVNGDDAVNMKDVLALRKFLAGLITEF